MPPTHHTDIESSATVLTWLKGMEDQWGEPLAALERRAKLDALRGFCRFVEKQPDEIIKECILVRDGTRKISVKGRRLYTTQVAAFQAESGLGQANAVRSFLIYNGIHLQTPIQRL